MFMVIGILIELIKNLNFNIILKEKCEKVFRSIDGQVVYLNFCFIIVYYCFLF